MVVGALRSPNAITERKEMAGANHPFMPGDNHAKGHIPTGGVHNTDSRIKAAHAKTLGARISDAAGDYKMGIANGPEGDSMAALQRAAKARLTGQYANSKSPGTMSYTRNNGR